ncbi:MAG: hypothetical protein PUC30_12295 [Lachnospiraceae bacterium]|nr:hypothetical protein [Lachnospiraceae bacterium]
MAKCKKCGAEIPEGTEYCAECLSELNTAKDSESYLDSLLNAVMKEEPEQREIVFQKKEASSLVSVPESKPEPEKTADEVPETGMVAAEVPEPEKTVAEVPDLKNYSIFDDTDEAMVNQMLDFDLQDASFFEEDAPFFEAEESAGETGELFFEEDEPEEKEAESWEATEESAEKADEPFGGTEEPVEEVMEQEKMIGDVQETEPVQGFDDFADLFIGGEEAVSDNVAAEEEQEAVLEDFSDLFSGTENEPAPEKASDSEYGDLADFFSGNAEDSDFFKFDAEPKELETLLLDEDKERQAEAVKEKADDLVEKKERKRERKGRIAALYHRLFDNVKIDPSKIKPQPTKEEIEAKKKEKQEAKEHAKEEKEALLAEKKAQEKQEKLEKQRVQREAKAEKKARKLEEAKLLLEEMEKTRINRAGASIVLIFFAMIAVVIIVGTSIFSYSVSIRNAEYEFNRDEYTLAFNEIYGLDIKDEDILLYDRIMTVMYVQKQLNSYYNYYGMKDMPKALDSLLKGLQRYEKYIELAVELDVDSDLDSVRKTILSEISASFSMSEQEAMEIIQSDSQVEYSKRVYDAVENMRE